jgi:membrane-bound lytic murein transglycosylase D
MKIMRTEVPHRRSAFWTLLPVLLAALLFGGCAQVASSPRVTSPADVQPQANPPEAAGAPVPDEAEPPAAASGVAADAELAAETDAASDDDTEQAEEVEPSPLDQIPVTPPEISPSDLEKDTKLVEHALPTFDMPMETNPQVVAYVEYFTTRHKELFAASLVRSGKYVEAFRTAFAQAGIPMDLVYMAHVESAFKTNAYSRAKAKGIYQFIAGTGRRYGLRIDSWVDERSDPEKSARAAAAYLKDLHGMFGDWYLALAAYNAGEGKIQRSLAKTKKDDFWSLASTRSLRAETRNYVPAILAATLIAKQPEKYGFDVRVDEPFVSDVVTIEGQTDLRVLARLVDVDPETLRQLNPQLRRGMTPPGTSTNVHVPVGFGPSLAQAYAALPEADRLVLVRHQVGKGESLAFIARHYGVSSIAIANANRLGKSATLHQGQELVIPAVAPAFKDGDVSRANAVAYRVRKGDTLSRIAKHYRTTPSAIASASGIGVHSSLRVGQRLVIPAKGSSTRAARSAQRAAPAPAAASAVVHTVRRGETLYRIADQYRVTVDQICTLNRLSPDGVIYPGLRLKIRAN